MLPLSKASFSSAARDANALTEEAADDASAPNDEKSIVESLLASEDA
jgi:hypothetical protein